MRIVSDLIQIHKESHKVQCIAFHFVTVDQVSLLVISILIANLITLYGGYFLHPSARSSIISQHSDCRIFEISEKSAIIETEMSCSRDNRASRNIAPNLPSNESEAEKQDVLAGTIEAFFENPEAMIIPAPCEDSEMPWAQSDNETSASISRLIVDYDVDETLRVASVKELASINELMWAAANGEQPKIPIDINWRCGFPGNDEEYQMVGVDEAHIGLVEIDMAEEKSTATGKAVIVDV